ncbi:MAG: DUF2125 domain-containing protein [Pseudomonadota bacterium]
MKRIGLYAVVAVAVVAGGWSALWFLGRGEITDRLALEAERLAARGVTLSYEGERVEGFPFGYTLFLDRLSVAGKDAGPRLEIPGLEARLDAKAPGTVVVSLPPEMTLSLPAEDAPREIGIESEGLVLTLSEAGGGARRAHLAGRSLLLVEAAPEDRAEDAVGLAGVALDLQGLDATLAAGAPAAGAIAKLAARADRLETIVTGTGRRGEALRLFTYTVDTQAEAPILIAELTLDARPLELALAEGLAEIPISASLQTGPTDVVVGTAAAAGTSSVRGDPADGRFTIGYGSGAAVLTLADGLLDTSLTLEAARLLSEPADEDVAFRGPVAINRVDFAYKAPTVEAEAMSPIRLRAAAGKITPGDEIWEALDPEGELDRRPMEVVLELEGTARLAGEDAAVPAELGNLEIRSAFLDTLGMTFRATGSLEFLQPQMLPIGTIELKADRSMQALRDLVAAGLLEPVAAETAMLLAANYARAGDDPEELRATVAFGEEGVFLNGLPIAGPVGAIPAPRAGPRESPREAPITLPGRVLDEPENDGADGQEEAEGEGSTE